MKKFVKAVSVALLVVVCALAFAGCDKSGSIKKAFENEGYSVSTVNTDNSTVKAALVLVGYTDEEIEEINKYEIYLCSKSILDTAVVVKFSSSSTLKSFLTDDGDTSAYDTAKADNKINGNCYFLTGSDNAKTIFKNA